MSPYYRKSIHILLIINLILIAPALYGVLMFSEAAFRKPELIVLVISLLAGIWNGIYLYRNRRERLAWKINLSMSLYAFAWWITCYFTLMKTEKDPAFLLVFFWPGVMIVCSLFVLANSIETNKPA